MKVAAPLLTLSFIAFRSIAKDAQAVEDRNNIQGTWTVESATQDGKTIAGFANEIVFAGNQFTMRDKIGKEQVNTFKLKPERRPKALVLTSVQEAQNPALGHVAYELSGDSLKLAITPPDRQPSEISDKGQLLVTLKRKKA